ncbi:IS4/Tn5 family transposase DNA-binding protein [Nostoc sp.]|uniref:IS4/Tn5 family transposase DNA-binding protein n=1 Tax=Nostoc sp. TaxID=1180 RepID=UPI003FA577F7
MRTLEKNPYCECDLGDKRLTQRAVSIADAIGVKYAKPLSTVFKSASDLKRSYEFFSNPKTTFEKLTQPSFKQTALQINGMPVVLAAGDTSFLDYKKILDKRQNYGPIGNSGNGLILHTSLALDPDFGQPLGLLWQKLWHREKSQKTPLSEEPEHKKQRTQEKQP